MQSISSIALILYTLYSQSSSFKTVELESGEVCSLRNGPVSIKLKDGEESSVVVVENGYFGSWTGRYNLKCTFLVEAKDNHGIYAVIQNLDFRKNLTSGDCIDYVEFSQPSRDSKLLGTRYTKAQSFCGLLNPAVSFIETSVEDVDDPNAIGSNSYVAKGNKVAVEIYVARLRLPPQEQLRVSIAFTAFKRECFRNKKGLRQCVPGECIWEGLFDDRVQNCPQRTCPDEANCVSMGHIYGYENPGRRPMYDSPNIQSGFELTIGAIVSTALIFALFGGCLFVCKKYRRLCWAPIPPRPPPPPMNTEPEVERTLPTAPPAPSPIKDLPPSYDSLFPTT